MTATFAALIHRDVPLLRTGQSVGSAAETVLAAGVPALPVIDDDGVLAGVFGEREFIHAIFPPFFDELGHAAFVPKSLDRVLEKGAATADEPVGRHMTTDHVAVGPDASDAELAETFLHHRVLIVPVVDGERVTGIITRADFFRALAERFRDLST
jgi:CBS domain-containing protein